MAEPGKTEFDGIEGGRLSRLLRLGLSGEREPVGVMWRSPTCGRTVLMAGAAMQTSARSDRRTTKSVATTVIAPWLTRPEAVRIDRQGSGRAGFAVNSH